jgi:cytosine/adenosine deaminase-related metal-dependent hydrolase
MAAMSENEAATKAWRARWVIPVDRPPIEGGVVTVARGRIVAVGGTTVDGPLHDLGDVALLPGLVNAHTHLEFSLLQQPLGRPGIHFADWLAEVIEWRRVSGASDEERLPFQAEAIAAGLAESAAAGVVAVGEIATGLWNDAVAGLSSDIELVAFAELLGLADERVLPLVERAEKHLAQASSHPGLSVQAALSPHAPYTMHPALLARAIELSAEYRLPLAMHLAESPEELELLASQTGPLVELLKSRGVWRTELLQRGSRPLDYLHLLANADRSLVIHGNYLTPEELEYLAQRWQQMSLVYCPRTHAYFGHQPYPLAAALAAGVRVAVGTDSRASNPNLRLFEELRHIARQHPTVQPEAILRMGTLAGAEALGLAELGSISPGKRASLLIVPLNDDTRNPLEWLLSGDHSPEFRCLALESS